MEKSKDFVLDSNNKLQFEEEEQFSDRKMSHNITNPDFTLNPADDTS